MRPQKEFFAWLTAVIVKLDNDHNLDLMKSAQDGYYIENPTLGEETNKFFLRRYRYGAPPDDVSNEIAGAYEASKLPWTKQGPGESHTPREASRDGQILPVDSNKGYRQPACVACGGYEELKPIEPGLFKDAHLCRACGIRARELTEDKDNGG